MLLDEEVKAIWYEAIPKALIDEERLTKAMTAPTTRDEVYARTLADTGEADIANRVANEWAIQTALSAAVAANPIQQKT